MVIAIIVAAGRGSRLKSALPKQVLPLAGRPLVEHAVRTFQRCAEVDRLVVVVPSGLTSLFPLKLSAYPKVACVIEGGETRQVSVWNGLQAASDAEFVLVHDAARPLVDEALIRSVLTAARRVGAAVPLVPVPDTVKRVEGDRVVATVPREGLMQAQTPQGFRRDLLLRAHREARESGFEATDDAQLVERLAHDVAWVEGNRVNLKITTPADLLLADRLLRGGPLPAGS
jgi:2-C-methyl-D-erythritol 4-phosphate cytidylyltransferase